MTRKVIHKSTRQRVKHKCDMKCAYCGCDLSAKPFQVDHYYPVTLHNHYRLNFNIDVHHYRNLLPSCRTCNHYKRADTPEVFRTKMTTLHERINKIYITKVGVAFGMVEVKRFSGYFYFEYLMFGIESHNMDEYPIHPAITDQSFFDKIEEHFNL